MIDKIENDEIIEARISIIHDALSTLSRVIGDAMGENRDPTLEDAKAAINAGLSLANALLVALTEMAHSATATADSVGKIAALMERDYQGDVSQAAEVKAEEINKEKTKRSFIGQPRK